MTVVESPPAEVPVRTAAPPHRGTTTVATKAIQKIFGRVAAGTPGVSAAELRGVKGWLRSGPPDDVAAHVETTGSGLVVAVDVTIQYPLPIAAVVGDLRDRLAVAASDQLGVPLARVDVGVVGLRPADRPPMQVRRVN